jgi:hypothetical protein
MGCGCKGACVSLGYGVASGWCVARHPPSHAFSDFGIAGLCHAAACQASPCAPLMAELARMLL